MLKYKNLNGKTEAVAANMITKLSSNIDYTLNSKKSVTYIHLTNKEIIKTYDSIETLLKRLQELK